MVEIFEIVNERRTKCFAVLSVLELKINLWWLCAGLYRELSMSRPSIERSGGYWSIRCSTTTTTPIFPILSSDKD